MKEDTLYNNKGIPYNKEVPCSKGISNKGISNKGISNKGISNKEIPDKVVPDYCIEDILEENARRNALLDDSLYDPLTGVGCYGERVEAGGCLVPRCLLDEHPEYPGLKRLAQERLRIVEDFEFWCARCVTIKDKLSGRNVRLVLNRPQRRLLAVMEGQRMAGRPVRVILLKARQWGGSTLVQMYLAWMQLVRHKGWNSLICGHLHATSKSIKRMYNLMLRHYPREMLAAKDGKVLRFSKLEGQPHVQQLESRECLVITGSSRSEDAVRGYDIALSHLSEVAFWQSSVMHSPDDLVRSVCGSIVLKPETVIVLESTANGVGDYFHDEWLRALSGRSDKEPVFVPWHEIGIYSLAVDDASALWEQLDDYERTLWDDGCTLEQINWYHKKRREYRVQQLMMAEYPSNASEAFTMSGYNPFAPEHLDRLAEGCTVEPVLIGDIHADGQEGAAAKSNVRLVSESNGLLKVWERPMKESPVKAKYLVVVDVGGRSEMSDYSVIAVLKMGRHPEKTRVVAQWRGHIDHDRLAWKSMQLAKFYNNALLAIESNTLTNEAARAGESEYILKSLYLAYGSMYKREGGQLGFHTNAKTKRMAIAELIASLRDGTYIERDMDAVNEMRDYEDHNGHYKARAGKHDDILMTRAIGLYIIKRLWTAPAPDKGLAEDCGVAHYPGRLFF